MTQAILEHVNVTVADPDKTAAELCDLYDWRVRWSGDAKDEGRSVHVGGEDFYLALYRKAVNVEPTQSSYEIVGGLNHIALVVDDLDDAEARVRAAGYEPHSFGDYEPGRRFYYEDRDGIEFEIVSYA